MKNWRLRPSMRCGQRIGTQDKSWKYQPKKTSVFICKSLKFRLHLQWCMHDPKERTQQILLFQEAEIENHGSVGNDSHLLPSTRRVSKSWASISSV